MQNLFQDLRYGLRLLAKSPGFTVVSVLTLALGIGANTAIFSIVNAILLRPLPFRDPQQLVALGEFDTRGGRGVPEGNVSYPDFADIRTRNHSFETVSAYHDNDATLTGAGQALHVKLEIVSSNLFPLLGTQPSVGRSFVDGEDDPGHHVAILSDLFWRRQFHGDSGVIGRTVDLNGRAYTIVGVMPAGFQFPVQAEATELWVTFSRDAETDDPKDRPQTAIRGDHYLNAIGRLKPGITLGQANADLDSIARALAAEYPNYNSYNGIGGRSEIDYLVGESRTPLLVLFGAVGLVLLIACANTANLLLARATNRAREIAIRAALGATRGRVVRQLLAEALALAIAGAVVGTLVAVWGLSAMLQLYPSNLPRAGDIGIDYRVLLFTVTLAAVTGIIFGLIPAWQISNPNLTDAMREGGRSATVGARHHRLRSGLVIAETALGMMLLVGAGLLIRSFYRLSSVDLGMNPQHVFTANFDLSETRYNPDQQDRFIEELFKRLNALPGVRQAAGTIPLPLSNSRAVVSFNLVEHPVPEANEPSAEFFVVTKDFFETLQIPLVRGRTFDDRDRRNSAPTMIINEEFAKKFFPHEDPIGRRVKIGAGEGEARAGYKTREIVGIVGNFRRSDLGRPPGAAYFTPLPQLMWGPPTLVVRTAGEPNAMTEEIRKVLVSMDPDAPLYEVRTLEDYLALDLGRARFQAVLLGLFAGVALLLTAVGLYGVMAYTVAQRTQEIGIRVALGASRADVLRMILARGIAITGLGLLIGIAGAGALTRLLSSLLYEVKPIDPATFALVSLLLGGTSMLASYIPAWRAAKVEPMIALHYE
ncbi:MAG TPA: ABC transporter permease [Terriglobales bacterium]|nr:ABC transporter permease [Terriglobales bacterium]